MIRTALEFIRKELDSYIAEREQDYAPGSIVDLDSLEDPVSDTIHVTMMLVGMEEERREGKRPVYIPRDNKEFIRLNPPVELDLYLLFAAHIASYETALRDLASVVSFFQANPVFSELNYPSINASVADPVKKPWQMIERLSFKIHAMNFEQQNNLWAMVGTRYRPSVVYKMNMLTIFDTRPKEKASRISELKIEEGE